MRWSIVPQIQEPRPDPTSRMANMKMRIWLLGAEDPSFDVGLLARAGTPAGPRPSAADALYLNNAWMSIAAGRWRTYMESYILSSPTELVSERVRGRMRRPFLNRWVAVFLFMSVMCAATAGG